MGRLIAAVVALAIFVSGSMYWSQAEQLQTMPEQPLCPGIVSPGMELTMLDPAAARQQDTAAQAKCGGCTEDCQAEAKAECGKCPADKPEQVDS